ncbi:KAP family P-loop NTPase fold protein [Tritonibacter mobilis]|uniref:KAP family P-loop NTPase fold protein n=1 Tax=Tritonibacter mobilis TaxID=379347 RepID=UPI0008069794|nr:P-loop NTPase fold protein [Tritonibacter mobilis]
MWSDNETDIDYLNHSEVAELICGMIEDDTLLPLSIGVFGGWGVGKSSVLKLVEKELKEDESCIVIEFDAWLYQGFDEAKTALMTVIAQELIVNAPEGLVDKAKSLYARTNKLKILGLGAEASLAMFGLPTFGFASKAVDSMGDVLSGEGDDEDLKALQSGAKEASGKVKGLLSPKEVKSAPEEITAFKNEFSELLAELDKKLVVFVDNLDRCLPKTAIQNLEAMRLFMSLPNTAFIVAADVDMVRHAVAEQFANASKKHVNDYLEKLIHFPFNVPRLGLREVQAFLVMLVLARAKSVTSENREAARVFLLEAIRNSWTDNSALDAKKIAEMIGADDALHANIENALRISPILAHSKSIQGNPRIIKRMMNVVKMRYNLANLRKMSLDEAVITKISLFERCTSNSAFSGLLETINAAPDGKSKYLSGTELSKLEVGTDSYPEAWKDHLDFIVEWGQLEPDISSVDLRPVVYLARETLPIQVSSSFLSEESLDAIKNLVNIQNRTSPAANKAIDNIPAGERSDVMTELISLLRLNADWSKRRNDVNGPVILAKKHAETKDELTRFLKGISSPPPWLKKLITYLEEEK